MGDVLTVLWPNRVNKNALQLAIASARGLTGGVITVSAKGRATGADAQNDGAQYGPDTPGTTTCGIQEAIHALKQVAQLDGTVGGGQVLLGPGRFTCSGEITLPNQFNFELQLKGSGKIATQVLYAGTNDFITLENITGSDPAHGGSKPFQFAFRDICFIYQQDTALKHLIYFQGKVNQGVFENCSFTTKGCIDFVAIGEGGPQGQGGGLLFVGGIPDHAVGTVGIRIDGGADNKILFRKCDFYGLAGGIIYGSDHGTFEDLMMVSIGRWWSGSFGSRVAHNTTAWTAINSPASNNNAINNILSVGACIMLVKNVYETNIHNCYFMESVAGIVFNQGGSAAVFNPHWETCSNQYLFSIDKDGDTGGNLQMFSNSGVAFTGPITYVNITNGTITSALQPVPPVITNLDQGWNALTYAGTNGAFDITPLFIVDLSTLKLTLGTGSTPFSKILSATATLDFASTAAQNSRDLTITVTGAAVGDTVWLGVPNGSVNANTCFTAWVSAANTVTVRFNNYSSAASDPASGTFRVAVIQW